MIVRVDNVTARIASGTNEERSWAQDYLSYTRKVRGVRETVSLVSHADTFPAGLVSALVKAGKARGRTVKVLRTTKPPVPAEAHPDIGWLRPYQVAAIQVARKTHRGVYHHVTGAGKTEVMVAMTDLYPCTWVIIVHKKDLLYEIAERFALRTGEEVGIIGDGKFSTRRVTVAMFQSLSRMLAKPEYRRFFAEMQGLMVDECHVVPADTFYRVTRGLRNAYFRYGFSGTPFARGDRKSVYTWGALGPVIHEVRAPKLVREGVLAQARVHMIPCVQVVPRTTWNEVYRRGIVESVVRNRKVVAVAKRCRKPAFLFVTQVDHGKELLHRLAKAGVPAEFIWGDAKTPVRRAAIRRLVHGDTDVIVCNVVFQEGIDVPELQTVILAQGGQSTIMVLQDVGRAMRRRARDGSITKDKCHVYDFYDRGNRWLQKHTRKRLKAYAIEKYPVVIEEKP